MGELVEYFPELIVCYFGELFMAVDEELFPCEEIFVFVFVLILFGDFEDFVEVDVAESLLYEGVVGVVFGFQTKRVQVLAVLKL
jgi:hypothetical protein